ncbi:MAG: hypothetical protein WAN10_16450 [Candidatus Acidiferrales bacterium]
MHKKILIGAVFLILAGLVWAANEPWKEKPYHQWDKADLALVLNDSPWAKTVVVDVNWKPDASSGGQSQMPTSDAAVELHEHIATQKGGGPDSSPPDASMSSGGSSGGTSATPKAAFCIRWYSSRVIREALEREAVLNDRISEAEGAKLLAEPVTDYEVIVFGPDMTPFQSVSEEQLKSASSLEGKQSKQKVAPASVRMNKSSNGRTNSIVFFFPKKTGSGTDVASAQEKGLEFMCKVKGLDLRNTFDTRKMVDKEGTDF